MADMSADKPPADLLRRALELGRLLADHRGGAVTVMDLRELNAWTDYFIIATVSSSAHLSGLEKHIKEYCREQGLDIARRSRRPAGCEDEWCLIDLGTLVIHLMTERTRSFYELERLWGNAKIISMDHQEETVYSSKSSS
ncbi:MAG: ribosome silencing factor [Treponema sp.]|jgi:ribosome-associated protein|nr:ribosome silencing factor [Treponema sp.]